MASRRRLLVVVEGPQNPLWDVRFGQYESLFRRSGFDVSVLARTTPFSPARFGTRLQRNVDRFWSGPLYRRLIRRQERLILDASRSVDFVYLVGLPSAELHATLCDRQNLKVVMDVVDALWLPYHRQFGWQSFEDMVAQATAVTCKSAGIASRVEQLNGNAFLVPDSPQLSSFDAMRDSVRSDPDCVTLGWIGSPDSTPSLFRLTPVLNELAERCPRLNFTILGADRTQLRLPPSISLKDIAKYNRDVMVREALTMDIGLFPQPDDEDALMRGASKARLYMAAEAVAVCQDQGENAVMIDDGVNGILAGQNRDWTEKLVRLIEKPEERRRIAARGLELVRRDYSLEQCFQRLIKVFNAL